MSVPMYSCSIPFVEGISARNASSLDSGINEVVTAPGDDTKSSSTLRPREKRTLWVGDLDRAEGVADEAYVKTHMFYEFAHFITGVRICRDKITRQPSFGFVEFLSEKEAQYVLEHMNGRYVPGRHHKYRLNWATFNLNEKAEPRVTFSRPAQLNRTKQDDQPDGKRQDIPMKRAGLGNRTVTCPPDTTSIWIGSLDPHTCREEVEELFEQHYTSVCLVKLILDPNTGLCKGFGFVHFRDANEAERALEEMNGALCRGRRIRVNRSNTNRGSAGNNSAPGSQPLQSAMAKIYGATALQAQQLAAEYCGGFVPTKRKHGVLTGDDMRVIIRGIDSTCSEDELRRHLGHFGEIITARLAAPGKAYVTFAEADAATNAVSCLNGSFIGATQVSLELGGTGTERHGETQENGTGNRSFYTSDPMASVMAPHNNFASALPGGCPVSTEDQHALHALQAAYMQQLYQLHYAGNYGAYAELPPPETEGNKEDDEWERRLVAEFKLSGGVFRDTDPSLLLPELLSKSMFSIENIKRHGSMERHIFLSQNPCQMMIKSDCGERFQMEPLEDEIAACQAAIEASMRKRLKTKVDQKLSLDGVDHEYLYVSGFGGL